MLSVSDTGYPRLRATYTPAQLERLLSQRSRAILGALERQR